ncbi:MAG: NAD(P)H-dependent oxidoreductase [Sneathiellales bacterium]|nr:NAD(P)H-dependent oxidoreductase [Sneathiellales bacterium]
MKCLLVYAHPLKDSLCQEITRHIAQELETKNHHIILKDLYQQQFDPALSAGERASYYQSDFGPEGTAEDIAELKDAEYLVLVFPTWWFGLPAILKGWIDRVFAPGHAYHHAQDLKSITPGLVKLKKVRVVTTLGSPWWVDKFVLREPVKKSLKYGVVAACTKNCDFEMLSLYSSESLTPEKVNRFIGRVSKFL